MMGPMQIGLCCSHRGEHFWLTFDVSGLASTSSAVLKGSAWPTRHPLRCPVPPPGSSFVLFQK